MSECKHREAEEIDIFLVYTKQMRKFIRCKKCGNYLAEVSVDAEGNRRVVE